jgi:hypothetical protein
MSITFNKPNKRRVFISSNRTNFFKIFSFVQEEDGDIYCHWPNFSSTKWLYVSSHEEELNMQIANTPENSQKLSLHRSGVVKFKQREQEKDLSRIKGNHLLNFERNEIGARHLFTSFLSEPQDLSPNSPFGNRPSDSPIFCDEIKPFTIMFFAIPQQTIPVRIHFHPSFNIDYFEDFKKDLGFGNLSLAYHDIFWFAYRTKNMKKWPKHTHVFYHDGHLVPLFLGGAQIEEKLATMNIALQEPTYKLEGSDLYITLAFPELVTDSK